MKEIKLSVIIPTRNRCMLLSGTLDSLTRQTFPMESFEIIVNDNGSTDETKQVVESYMNKIPNLMYYYDPKPGLHVGRHNGYKMANSDILVYADDDIEAFPMWLEGIWESFQDPSVMLVGGKNLPKWLAKPPFWIEEKWYQLCQFGHCLSALSLIDFGDDQMEIPAYFVYGCNFSVRKSIITETKGFHPDGVPFDMIEFRGDGESYVDHYIINHNYKTIYNPKASVYHLVPEERLTVDYFKRRMFRAGVEQSYIDKRYGKNNRQSRDSLFRRMRRFLKNRISDSLVRDLYPKVQQNEIEKQIAQSFSIGYDYHDAMYKKSSMVRDWVHKDNYLDC